MNENLILVCYDTECLELAVADTIFAANLYEFTRLVWTFDYNLMVLKFFVGFRKQMESFWLQLQTEKMFLIRK